MSAAHPIRVYDSDETESLIYDSDTGIWNELEWQTVAVPQQPVAPTAPAIPDVIDVIDECPVCRDPFQGGTLACGNGHLLCLRCHDGIFATKRHFECPLCRDVTVMVRLNRAGRPKRREAEKANARIGAALMKLEREDEDL